MFYRDSPVDFKHILEDSVALGVFSPVRDEYLPGRM
jgi:hypothetical protein